MDIQKSEHLRRLMRARKKAISLTINILLIAAAYWGISKWQTRNLVPENTMAPSFSLRSTDGNLHNLPSGSKSITVLYFFSPWCAICKLSSGNIEDLKKTRPDINVLAIGLSWEMPQEIVRFAAEHKLTVPVLFGTDEISGKYKIESFPTIYIIDENGIIKERLVGYTSETGIRLRVY